MGNGTAGNVLVGVGELYVAPVGSDPPSLSNGAFSWGNAWTACGYTDGGVTLEYAPSFFEGEVDQELAPVITRLTGEKATIKTNLAEATLENMNRLITASVYSTAAGYKALHFGSGEMGYTMVGFEGEAPGGERRVVVFWKAQSRGTATLTHKKDALTTVSAEWLALVDSAKAAGERLCMIKDGITTP